MRPDFLEKLLNFNMERKALKKNSVADRTWSSATVHALKNDNAFADTDVSSTVENLFYF